MAGLILLDWLRGRVLIKKSPHSFSLEVGRWVNQPTVTDHNNPNQPRETVLVPEDAVKHDLSAMEESGGCMN